MRTDDPAAPLLALLPARRRLATRLIWLATCTSTQEVARADGAAAGELWIAREQTGGRGRTARDWWSGPPGANLAVSLTVAPALEPPPSTLVAAACALAATLDRMGAGPAAVKWPNDVLLDGRKIAGLIGEWLAGSPPRVLLGAGVNLAAAPPPELARRPATCLDEVLTRRGLRPVAQQAVLADWLIGLERRLARARRTGLGALEEEFLARLRRWAPRGVRDGGDRVGGPLLEFRFASGLAWTSEGRIHRRPIASIADLETLP